MDLQVVVFDHLEKRTWLIYFGVIRYLLILKFCNIGILQSQFQNKAFSTILQRYLISRASLAYVSPAHFGTFYHDPLWP